MRQFTANDTYNMSCEVSISHPNCPDPVGPDLDFGAPPILYTPPDGRQLVLAGQKSGDVWALDAVTGDTLWTRRIGRGGKLGGIHWGMAVDPVSGQLFVPVSDVGARGSELEQPGLFALDITDGSIRWSAQRDVRCEEKNCWTGNFRSNRRRAWHCGEWWYGWCAGNKTVRTMVKRFGLTRP